MEEYNNYYQTLIKNYTNRYNSNYMQNSMLQMPTSHKFKNGLNVADSPTQIGHNSINLMSEQINNYRAGANLSAQDRYNMIYGNNKHSPKCTQRKYKKRKINQGDLNGVTEPKRANTAYINFLLWYKNQLKSMGAFIPRMKDLGIECTQKWNQMDEEDKRPFVEIANLDRERYNRELAKFKPVKDSNRPKRPGSAFIFFLSDFRKEMARKIEDKSIRTISKLAGEKWKIMSDEDKKPYYDRQYVEGDKYRSEMVGYRREIVSQMISNATKNTQKVVTNVAVPQNDDSSSNSLHIVLDEDLREKNTSYTIPNNMNSNNLSYEVPSTQPNDLSLTQSSNKCSMIKNYSRVSNLETEQKPQSIKMDSTHSKNISELNIMNTMYPEDFLNRNLTSMIPPYLFAYQISRIGRDSPGLEFYPELKSLLFH